MSQADALSTEFIYDVYLSYAPADEAWVDRELRPRLKRAKVRTIDETGFAIGAPILRERERAVQQSRYTLLVISKAWLAGAWQEFDELLTGNFGRETRAWRALPLLIEPCDLPPRLGMLVAVDLTTDEAQGWQRLLQTLTAASEQPVETEDTTSATDTFATKAQAPYQPATRLDQFHAWFAKHITRRRVRIGALVATALTLIGLSADLISIRSCFAPAPSPTVVVATATAPIPGVTPTTTPASFTYGVTVKDKNNDQPLAKAQVRIEVEGKAPLTGYTDSNGYARLFVPAALAEHPGRLTVEADGYTVETQEIDLWPGRLPAEIRLKRR